ncbi:MAG TPA: asparagine synthase (glutamine-hydrolyzing) [Gemmatimonadales bacterium]|nr:asparagine synthase (glutamine-hydrolyzing) [Gemmatimonadales bacterium]
MCGICGIVQSDPHATCDPALFEAMRDSLTHRGPDDAGSMVEPGIALGSRRLAIRDLSPRGHMPMQTPDGRYTIVYNGEVYNSNELRRQLEARGWTFRSTSDTEVVLYLFAEQGPAMLDRLNGMFAIAIWDRHERALFLARDRLGVKPLYYARGRNSLSFASEPKSLFAAGMRPAMNQSAWDELMCFSFVSGEETVYDGVVRLLPGHFLVWRDGAVTITRWWNLGERVATPMDGSPDEWFRSAFDDSVGLRRISDVPIGVLLSGGLDSASVAASLAIQAGTGVESFTMGFAERGFDERPLAREVVSRWGLTSHEMTVSPADVPELIAEAVRFNDEPLAHGHEPHLLAISRHAKPRVTVLLSGEGADELLGGYPRYRPLLYPGALRAAQGLVGPAARRMVGAGRRAKLYRLLGLPTLDAAVLFNASDVLPTHLAALGHPVRNDFAYRRGVLDEARRAYPASPVRQAMYLDQHTFLCYLLDRNDKMTMGASIECRVPFLDYRLIEGAARLPDSVLFRMGKGKAIQRSALGDRIPRPLHHARKWGFVVPWVRYLREVPAFREQVMALSRGIAVTDGPFERRLVDGLAQRFLAGDHAAEPLVVKLLKVTQWHDACIAPLTARPSARAS